MAVEARHNMNIFPSHQFILTNRDFLKINQESGNMINYYAPNYSASSTMNNNNINNNNHETLLPALIHNHHQLQHSLSQNLQEAKTTTMNTNTNNNNQAESGLTHSAVNPPRKRPRSEYQSNDNYHSLLDDNIAIQIQQHQSEIDRFIAQYSEKVRFEVEKQRKREARMVATAIEEGIAKRLREKDEEIMRMGKLNWVLQERVKTLCVENQIWKDLAQSNEATAISLRTNLEQLLLAHVGSAAAAAGQRNRNDGDDDAESCCGSSGENDAAGEADTGRRRCRGCGEAEARVLVLPCRHLCLCTACGSTVRACPVCDSVMTASVRVNFS